MHESNFGTYIFAFHEFISTLDKEFRKKGVN